MSMRELKVQIIRFVDDCQPGVVECEFHDANMTLHRVIDNVPIFTDKTLWSNSEYPQPGTIRCEVLEMLSENVKPRLAKVTIDRPDGLKSTHGQTDFLINEPDLI